MVPTSAFYLPIVSHLQILPFFYPSVMLEMEPWTMFLKFTYWLTSRQVLPMRDNVGN